MAGGRGRGGGGGVKGAVGGGWCGCTPRLKSSVRVRIPLAIIFKAGIPGASQGIMKAFE